MNTKALVYAGIKGTGPTAQNFLISFDSPINGSEEEKKQTEEFFIELTCLLARAKGIDFISKKEKDVRSVEIRF